jgi:hypothetical protein
MTATEIFEAIHEVTVEALKAAHAAGLITVNSKEEASALISVIERRVAANSEDFIRAVGTEIWNAANGLAA